MSKDKYKVTNWHHYNEGLVQRGAITIWISKEVLDQWQYQGKRKRGGKVIYSDQAIEVCALVRKVYHLALRQTQGFIKSFFATLHLLLAVPCYTQISRRCKNLPLDIQASKGKPITDIVVDSTGLKVYGEGEWRVRLRGWGKHRTWMKLHAAPDSETGQVQAVELTTNAVDDGAVVEKLLQQIGGNINSFTGDGAYDKTKVRKAIRKRAELQGEDILEVIAPQHNAVVSKHQRAEFKQRNDDLIHMESLGRKEWKVVTGYHQRSKAETFMFRYKVILGGSLQSREKSRQQTEVKIGCKILNIMLHLAKPISQRVA